MFCHDTLPAEVILIEVHPLLLLLLCTQIIMYTVNLNHDISISLDARGHGVVSTLTINVIILETWIEYSNQVVWTEWL